MRNMEASQNANYDEQQEELARERLKERLERRAHDSLQNKLEEDISDGLWQKIVKKTSDPNVLGALAAVGFATMMTADVVLNGPSEFVVNSPEAATTAMALGAAAIGAVFNKFGRKADVIDTKRKQQAKREAFKKEQS